MKAAHAFLLAVLMAASTAWTLARGKSIYTLVLEVQSYMAMGDGSYLTTGILTTPKGKFRCTMSDQKHYLIVGSYDARKIGQDRLRVIVSIKRQGWTALVLDKNERWTFKIISEDKVGKQWTILFPTSNPKLAVYLYSAASSTTGMRPRTNPKRRR